MTQLRFLSGKGCWASSTMVAIVIAASGCADAQPKASPSPAVSPSTSTGLVPTPAETPSARHGWIVFASERTGNYDIYSMRDDGRSLTRLTRDPREETWPSWSPNGNRIVFVREHEARNGFPNDEIWSMRADGANQRRLTKSHYYYTDTYPEWSPDGHWIVYTSSWDGASIYAMTPDDKRHRWVVVEDQNSIHEDASWFPDGRRVAYIEEGGGLYTAASRCNTSSGCRTRSLKSNFPAPSNPVVSPDGADVLAGGDGPVGKKDARDLWVVAADGSGDQRRLEELDASDTAPGAWSPDGTRVVFYSDRNGSYDIYTMWLDGSHLTRLTRHRRGDIYPDWTYRG